MIRMDVVRLEGLCSTDTGVHMDMMISIMVEVTFVFLTLPLIYFFEMNIRTG